MVMLVGEQRQLVENLARLQAGLAVERLREEQQAHRPRHRREVVAEPFLIRRRDQCHRCRPTAESGPVRLLEQIIERLAGARRAGRAGLALDRRARREERAQVSLVLRGDARGQRLLRALPAGARVERHAVDAAVQVDAAAGAAGVRLDRQRPAGCRSARTGRPRASPSGSASSVRTRSGAAVPARAARARSSRAGAMGRGARPGNRAGGTCDPTCRASCPAPTSIVKPAGDSMRARGVPGPLERLGAVRRRGPSAKKCLSFRPDWTIT